MKKKITKVLTIILIVILMIFITNDVFATSGSTLVNQFGGTTTVNTNEGESIITKLIGQTLSIARIVTIGISVIIIIYLGIKYMSAAPSEKANIKSQLITFVVGAIVVVGAVTLLDIVKSFAGSVVTK